MIIHHGLNAFFELTTIFRPGYHQRKIEWTDAENLSNC
jgi:hypothetical protein